MHYRQVIVNLALHVSRENITSIYGTTMNDTFSIVSRPLFRHSLRMRNLLHVFCILSTFFWGLPATMAAKNTNDEI